MICSKCGKDFPIENFPKNSYRNKDGILIRKYRSYCKDCYNKKNNEWKNAHPDKVKEYASKYRDKNRDYLRVKNRERYYNNPEVRLRQAERQKLLPKERRKSASLRSKYKLSIDEYLALPKACEICGSTDKISIDHDHKTGKVRGVLCYRCNVSLGFMNEDLERAEGLVLYIKERCNNNNGFEENPTIVTDIPKIELN